MVLESLRADAPVNINNLVIESPRKPEAELPFDPKRDITEDDLKSVDDQIKADLNDRSNYWRVIASCASLKLLFPNRPLPVDFNGNEKLGVIREVFNFEVPRFAKLVYPKKPISDYGRSVRDYMDKQLQQATKEVNLYIYNFPALGDLKLFYPEAIQQLLTDKEAIKNSLYNRIGRCRNEERWEHLAETAASARIALEDDFDLKLSAKDWRGMHKELVALREIKYWEVFGKLAGDMKILAAEKVRVTPNEGLVLTMPEPKPDFRQDIPPLPQMRRF